VLTVIGFALLLSIIFGATISSGEFRHSTATVTYLAFPNRVRVLIAKLIAAASAGLAFGTLGFAASTAVAMIFIAANGHDVALGAGTIVGYAAGATLATGLLAALGVGLGTLIRAQLAVPRRNDTSQATPKQRMTITSIGARISSWLSPFCVNH
jgi:ABC-type transport system involved in multi-copper enzyme maturation permease subunit